MESDLAGARADYDRLAGELRTREESVARADLQLRQRQQDFDEINAERQQIAARRRADNGDGAAQFMTVAMTPMPAAGEFERSADQRAVPYPAALAVLQADVDASRRGCAPRSP